MHSLFTYILKKTFSFLFVAFLFMLLLTSCQQKPAITGFDEKTWKEDVRGCQNKRMALVSALEKAKPQLIGLRHTTIIDVLGNPEGNSLEKSGQRIYYYFIESGPQCQDKHNIKNADKIFVQFDALDRAKYITIGK